MAGKIDQGVEQGNAQQSGHGQVGQVRPETIPFTEKGFQGEW